MYASNLGYFDRDILIEWFMHHMSQEQRQELMARFPDIYNRLYDEKYVRVFRNCDGEDITRSLR
jgi:hypothetical protein